MSDIKMPDAERSDAEWCRRVVASADALRATATEGRDELDGLIAAGSDDPQLLHLWKMERAWMAFLVELNTSAVETFESFATEELEEK